MIVASFADGADTLCPLHCGARPSGATLLMASAMSEHRGREGRLPNRNQIEETAPGAAVWKNGGVASLDDEAHFHGLVHGRSPVRDPEFTKRAQQVGFHCRR